MSTKDKNSKQQGEKAMEVEISEEYVASKKEYWDFYSSMKTSYDKGLAEGHAEGLVEGEAKGHAEGLVEGEAKGRAEALAESEAKRAEERLSNAKALLANGVPLEVIVKSLHLTDEEAARLRDIFPAQ